MRPPLYLWRPHLKLGSPKLGVGKKQVLTRRQGTDPCGGAMHFSALYSVSPAAWASSLEKGNRVSSGKTGSMPRQRTHHSRITYVFPDDSPQRLERFKEGSGLPWAELNRRLGTHPETVRRWRDKGVRPSMRHMMAPLDLPDDLHLGHLFHRVRQSPSSTVVKVVLLRTILPVHCN